MYTHMIDKNKIKFDKIILRDAGNSCKPFVQHVTINTMYIYNWDDILILNLRPFTLCTAIIKKEHFPMYTLDSFKEEGTT